jgi:S-layer homology domain
MVRTVRTLTLALAVGLVAGAGFWGTNALASHQFGDVSDTSPFHDDVGWMAQHGIATGFPNGDFRPTESVNRQQASRWFRNYNLSLRSATNQVNPAPGTIFSLNANCGPDSRAIAGGGQPLGASNLFITASYTSGNNWWVFWRSANSATVDPTSIFVYALCAPDFSTG